MRAVAWYPAIPEPLGYFLTVYFNQDWAVGQPTIDQRAIARVVERFALDEPLEDVVTSRDALAGLLASGIPADELRSYLCKAGLEVWPPAFGMSYVQWAQIRHG